MLCSKCGRKIPKGQEVNKIGRSFGIGGAVGGTETLCKKCAFPPFYKKFWFWVIIIFVVICIVGAVMTTPQMRRY